MSIRAAKALGTLGTDERFVAARLRQGPPFSALALSWLDRLADPRAREACVDRAAQVTIERMTLLSARYRRFSWRLDCGVLQCSAGGLAIDGVRIADVWGRSAAPAEVLAMVGALRAPRVDALRWHGIGCVSCGFEREKGGICRECEWQYCIENDRDT